MVLQFATNEGNSFPVHGASFAPTDYHTLIEGRSVWECSRMEQAYRAATCAARPGVAAWRFPPHSLASNTLRLLLSLFSTSGILIEGFGAGTSFSAVAGSLPSSHV